MFSNIVYKNNVYRKVKIHRVSLTLSVIFIALLLLLRSDLSPDLYFINFGSVENVSCHYDLTGDALEPIDQDFAPVSNSIFFHETSCKGGLNSRQACSVESAARTHPDRDIYVLFSAPVNKISLQDVSIELLKKFSNVKFRRVHIIEYAKGTRIEKLIASGALNRTRWPISHTSDVLRFLTLYKWGGVYLDLDMVVAKSFDDLPKNWAARESEVSIASSILAFYRDDMGRMVANAALSDLAQKFRGDSWDNNGPAVITRVLKDKCGTADLTAMSADVCQGFEVFKPELFFPIRWQDAHQYFEPGVISDEPYAYHVWNRMTQDTKLPSDSVYAQLAKRFCPVVYETYREYFGS